MPGVRHGKEKSVQRIRAQRLRKAKLECVSQKVAHGKRPQEALRQSEAWYRQLFEGVGDAVMVYGLNGRFLDCNKLTLERLGYNYDEFLNLSAGDIVHPDFHATMRDSQKKIWAGQATVVESAHRCKDGRVIPIEVNACRIEYDGQQAILAVVRDITERKQAEEQIERLAKFPSENPYPVLRISSDGTILYANAAGDAFLQARNTAVGQPAPPEWHHWVSRVLKSGLVERRELENAGRVFALRAVPVVDSGYVNFYGVDVTEQKRAEQALRQSEEKYRDLFENARDTIITTDVEARITGVNKLVEEYGFKKDQLLGKSIFDFIVEQHKERGLKDFKSAISGNPVRGEMDVITLRGIFTAEYIDNPIKRGGEIIGIQAILRDITERKKAEQLLRKERDRAQKYLDVAGVMLVAIDSEQRVGLINKKGCEILGYKEEEILGKNWFNNFLPERVQREVQAVFQRLMCQQEWTVPERHESPILTKSGDERLMAWHNTVLRDDAGKVIAALGSGEDITEQRKAERKSLQYQSQLRSVASQLTVAEERERRRIATELHDQIGQSLAISKIKLDRLRHSMRAGEQARALEEVCNALGQAITEVRSLTFDLSSPILHELGLEAAIASWLAEEIEAKYHISTEFVDDGQPKPLDEDVRALLFRNVRELLINIVRHANARAVKVSIRKVNKQIELSVQDDGVGFEPAEALAKGVREGKYGLFSVKERLEQLGGRLEIESAPDRGCKVTMTVPLKQDGT